MLESHREAEVYRVELVWWPSHGRVGAFNEEVVRFDVGVDVALLVERLEHLEACVAANITGAASNAHLHRDQHRGLSVSCAARRGARAEAVARCRTFIAS